MIGKHQIVRDDVVAVCKNLQERSFDACLCDPPYHLTPKNQDASGFMGKKWDGGGVAFDPETWAAVRRCLKPGASLMAFGGRRTFHRMACAIEDAGFLISDVIMWVYAQGRPFSKDISKAIDGKLGAEREVVGKYQPPGMSGEWNLSKAKDERSVNIFASSRNNLDITAAATTEAKTWDGYGTALKPSYEPIIWAVNPVEGTYAENAMKWGVAGINVSGCRTPLSEEEAAAAGSNKKSGRWPADVILDDVASRMMNMQQDGASRFFFCSKVSTAERNAGVDAIAGNLHPTLKPLKLAAFLASLMIPPKRDGCVRRMLVPFSGAGSEMAGALLAGWDDVVGIENGGGDEAVANEYAEISEKRIAYWSSGKAELLDEQEEK